jgi:thiol-disulfide isomerase/thioredoxin
MFCEQQMFVLFAFGASFSDHPGEVVSLNIENWESHIGKGNSDSVWVVGFLARSSPPSRDLIPVLTTASTESDGLLHFGIVHVDSEQGLTVRFEIRKVPTILILHKNDNSEYKGKRNASALIKAAVKFIPDKCLPVDADWQSETQETVILFTNKTTTPPIWAAVSCVFQGRAKVGISSDPAIRALFKIEKTPTILFQNRTYRTVYTGENSFTQLRNSIGEFLKGEYEEPFRFISDFFLPDEFLEECTNFSGFCVVHVETDLDPKLKDLQQRFKSRKVKFFYGDEDLPFEFMQPGKVYVIQQQKKLGLVIDSVSELAVTLSNIFDQTVKLVPFDEL